VSKNVNLASVGLYEDLAALRSVEALPTVNRVELHTWLVRQILIRKIFPLARSCLSVHLTDSLMSGLEKSLIRMSLLKAGLICF